MQWVVTTGRSVEEATERALDALGIDEDELEVEVVDEPGSSLFGLRTTPARVRARVRPTRPRPKLDRRDRRRKDRKRRAKRGRGKAGSNRESGSEAGSKSESKSGSKSGSRSGAKSGSKSGAKRQPASAPKSRENQAESADTRAPEAPKPEDQPKQPSPKETRGAPMSDIPLTEQEPTAVDFVRGLVEAFGAEATVESEHLDDDDAIEIRVEGEDLGLLVGQRGNTLSSIAELTRTAVAQQHEGRLEGRLRVDVAGYRARREEALVRFVQQVADKVLDTGSSVALEPMSPPDRKIVHDAANDIDGVHTSSRGEDRRRHVVIHPD